MTTRTLFLVAVLLRAATALEVTISPQHAHIDKDDQDVTVRCVADVPITRCQLRVKDTHDDKPPVDLSQGADSNVPGFRYTGDGLQAGHCGATISPSALPGKAFHGFIECRVRTAESDWAYATMSLFRSKPPNAPTMTLDITRHSNETSTLSAECTVTGCRPAATITWMLDGELITSGTVTTVPDDRWVLPHEDQTTTQQLTMTLDVPTAGKKMWCRAHHVALSEPINSHKIRMVI